MEFPLLTNELAARIHRCHEAYVLSSMAQTQQEPGNPPHIRIDRFDTATVCLSEAVDWEEVNRISGIETLDDQQLDASLAYVRGFGIRCHFEMAPAILNKDLLGRLSSRGLSPSRFWTILYGAPLAMEPTSAQ